MNRKRNQQGIANGILIILFVCFLLVFVRTCFNQSSQSESQSVQTAEALPAEEDIVVAPVPVETPLTKEVERPSPENEGSAMPEPEANPVVEPIPQVEKPKQETEDARPIPVPMQPSSFFVSVNPVVPGPPKMQDPIVVTQEDYDAFYAPQQEEGQNEEKDPFADFFVSGEDTSSLYENGQYFLSFYVNDEYVGDIETEFAQPTKLVNTTDLHRYLDSTLKADASIRLFAGNPEYLSLEELAARGMPTTFDSAAFALHMTVNYNDMSVRILSVSTTSPGGKRDTYALSGATELTPAKLSWLSTMSFYGSLTYASDFSGITNKTGTLYINNSLGFLGLGVDFSTSFYTTEPYFNLGTWTAFHDFVQSSQRLTFGSVGSNLSARTNSFSIDTNIGFTVEKNYSYGSSSALGNQFQYSIEVVEPSVVKIYINDETKEVFQRRLTAGTYRLKDFVFTQGTNKIRIDIIPDARPDDVETYYVDTSYDSRLLGRGDTLYGYGMSIPRGNSTTYAGGAFHFKNPLKDSYISYYPQFFTARYWQSVGLTDTFTFSLDVSATPGVFSGTMNGVWATMIGTTQFQGTTRFSEAYATPLFTGAITERFNDSVLHGFGSLSLSTSFVMPAKADASFSSTTSDVMASVVGSFAFSATGLFTKLRYSVSGSLTYVEGYEYPVWSVSGSTGFSPLRGLSFSGSMTMSASDNTKPWNPTIAATLSGSYSFMSNLSSSASSTYSTANEVVTSVGLSYRPSASDSLSLTLSGFHLGSPLDHSLYATWSHVGKFYNFTLRQQVSDSYNTMMTSATLTTAIAFADGTFGMGRSASDIFLLVKPEGELKHSQISVARSMDSSPQLIPKYLGSGLFTNITPYQKNSIVVYGGGESTYATTTAFMFQFTPGGRQAYVAKIDLPPTFTITGVIKHADGSVYEQYSSPIYKVTRDEHGNETLEVDSDYYLFTDQVGRFVLESMPAGDYSFDLQVDDNTWYAVRFTIPEMKDKKLRAIEYEDINDGGPYDENGFSDYDHTITLKTKKMETEGALYAMLFPETE